jgi:DNA-binding NtrC family response regulator
MLAEADMSAQDVSAELTDEPRSDELHRTIRRFRRAQGRRFSIESILGSSGAMQKVRSQIAAAIASGANTLICGRRGSGRGHIARAIHYGAAGGDESKLLPIDCKLLNDDLFRRVLDAATTGNPHDDHRVTLLFENIEEMSAAHQSFLARAIDEHVLKARVVATSSDARTCRAQQHQEGEQSANQEAGDEMPGTAPDGLNSELFELLSTITIQLPRLVDRIEDLPVLSQYFLEACNEGSVKQIGSIRAEALDMLALYEWPGELAQLREVICTAHRNCKSHEIAAPDLPQLLKHASQAASRVRRALEPIVLDDLLASVEKEVIARALQQANGNKSGAANLLGITRPRLYRRLVQLGMVTETEADSEELPEFIERDAAE